MSLPSNQKGKTDSNDCIQGINHAENQHSQKEKRLKVKEDEGGQGLT